MSTSHAAADPLVSIIIPAYNAARYLNDSVGSVLTQDYSNWELIVVDDGSTDNSAAVVAPFLSDPRITYVKKENGGVSRARNYGAALAKGQYLCFLDADDLFHSNNLSEKVKVLNEDASIGLVHADTRMTNEAGEPNGDLNTGLSGTDLHLALLLWKECVIPAPSSIMVRRQVFIEVGQWDPEFSTAADQEFFIRLTHRYKIQRINKPLTSYRVVDGSMSRNPQVFERDHQRVYAKAEKNGLFPNNRFKRQCFANLHLIIAGTWWNYSRSVFKTSRHLAQALVLYPQAVFNRVKHKLLRA